MFSCLVPEVHNALSHPTDTNRFRSPGPRAARRPSSASGGSQSWLLGSSRALGWAAPCQAIPRPPWVSLGLTLLGFSLLRPLFLNLPAPCCNSLSPYPCVLAHSQWVHLDSLQDESLPIYPCSSEYTSPSLRLSTVPLSLPRSQAVFLCSPCLYLSFTFL